MQTCRRPICTRQSKVGGGQRGASCSCPWLQDEGRGVAGCKRPSHVHFAGKGTAQHIVNLLELEAQPVKIKICLSWRRGQLRSKSAAAGGAAS
eukprot:351140-Chlamydomonas_euryale.AAC.1